jgi:crotonobetaine/carnitine-CoA ligase
LPLFHVNALMFGVLGATLGGGRSCFARRFSLSGFWPEIERTGATIATLLGSLAALVAKREEGPEPGATTLRTVLAVPLPTEIERLWENRFGVRTLGGMYGQTEASPLAITPPGTLRKPGSMGQVNRFDFDVRIFDENDEEVSDGTVGEIVCRPLRPGMLFDGYWRNPEETVRSMRNLWYHTGDLGYLDEDSYLFFADRRQDYLRRRGENVSSVEVEAYLQSHTALQDVAVHAVPSDLGEDEIKVTAVLKEGQALGAEELVHFAAGGLPFFAVPRYVEFRDSLPRNQVGRVLKTVLRQEGVTPGTWDREAAAVPIERR